MGPLLAFSNLSKSFPGVRALDDVSFGVDAGSVHALLGENGAGKSTLLKILSGAYRPDFGSVSLDGKALQSRNTRDTIQAGVAVIYQELHLVPDLTVAENLFLGRMPATGGFVDWRTLNARASELLLQVSDTIQATDKVGRLTLAQRQMVEIAKSLSHNAQAIAFDEPTSSLSQREVDRLFQLIRKLKSEGKAILYVSHRMDEIFALCDAATVLRDGKHVATTNRLADVTSSQIVTQMVGRTVEATRNRAQSKGLPIILEVKNISGSGVKKPVSLTLEAGEILGIFGLVGAGRTELMRLIVGVTRPTTGTVSVDGKFVAAGLAASRQAGLVLLPEDRKKEGIIPIASVQDNHNLVVRQKFSSLGFWISDRRERANSEAKIKELNVKTPSPSTPIKNLSGGNQQKVVIGRLLGHCPRVLILDEPTRGIDIAAKQEVHHIIRGLAEAGAGVIVVSSEMPELLTVADRILVMCEGDITGQVASDEATESVLLSLALPQATVETS